MSSLTENASALLIELEQKLDTIALETDDSLRQPELAIEAIQKSLSRLKELVYSHTFSDQEEEIYFFKNTKPNFFSKLIYNVKVYNIEMHKPNGSDKAKRKYLLNELHNIESFFSRNLDFIKYYRTQKTYLDHKYFVRGAYDLSLTLDTFFFETDPQFSTSHDYKVSKIKASELLEIYIKGELAAQEHEESQQGKGIYTPKVKRSWTASKAACIELIYALQSAGVFNNSNTSLKDLTLYFEAVFNIDLGNYHVTFHEIKERKNNRTQFIDLLKDALLRRMEEKD
jgi:hypothetical protein